MDASLEGCLRGGQNIPIAINGFSSFGVQGTFWLLHAAEAKRSANVEVEDDKPFWEAGSSF